MVRRSRLTRRNRSIAHLPLGNNKSPDSLNSSERSFEWCAYRRANIFLATSLDESKKCNPPLEYPEPKTSRISEINRLSSFPPTPVSIAQPPPGARLFYSTRNRSLRTFICIAFIGRAKSSGLSRVRIRCCRIDFFCFNCTFNELAKCLL
jgi:hypothetical protein